LLNKFLDIIKEVEEMLIKNGAIPDLKKEKATNMTNIKIVIIIRNIQDINIKEIIVEINQDQEAIHIVDIVKHSLTEENKIKNIVTDYNFII